MVNSRQPIGVPQMFFRERYPDVILQAQDLITDNGSLMCGGGAASYIDLALPSSADVAAERLQPIAPIRLLWTQGAIAILLSCRRRQTMVISSSTRHKTILLNI